MSIMIKNLSKRFGDFCAVDHVSMEVPHGSLVALLGSTGWVEIAEVNGDAARHLAAGPGTTIWVRKVGGTSSA